MDDRRGASATGDAFRAARILNQMGGRRREEASVGEIERLSRFRVDRAKGNYSAPAAGSHLAAVPQRLHCRTETRSALSRPWDFPRPRGRQTPEQAAADRKAEEVFLRLLDKFTARGINVSANVGPTMPPPSSPTSARQRLQSIQGCPQGRHDPPARQRAGPVRVGPAQARPASARASGKGETQ